MSSMEAAEAVSERSRPDQAWARWLGRGLDGVLLMPFALLAAIALSIAVEFGRLPADIFLWTSEPIGAVVFEVGLTFLLFGLWETLFLSNTGTTPGKWVMGIGVRQADGRRLGAPKAAGRFVWVYVLGMGVGIPIVSLIAALSARGKLVSDGVTPWDNALKCDVKHRKRHPAIWALVIFLVIGANAAALALSRLAA